MFYGPGGCFGLFLGFENGLFMRNWGERGCPYTLNKRLTNHFIT